MWVTIGALLLICAITSTRQGRAEARELIRRYEWMFNLGSALILALFAYAIWRGPSEPDPAVEQERLERIEDRRAKAERSTNKTDAMEAEAERLIENYE